MIKVIKHGNKRATECSECGCVFEYEKEDVKTSQTGYNDYEYYLYCPDCRKLLLVPYFS